MSDHPRVAQRNMKKIFISNDSLFDLFYWLAPVKVGTELALVSRRFYVVADKNLGIRKWTLGNLIIIQKEIGYFDYLSRFVGWVMGRKQSDAIIVKNYWLTENEEHLPLPEEPLPDNVIGFKCITIRYVDHKVIDFLRRIRRLFQPKNNKLVFWGDTFDVFRRRISPTFLLDWANVRLLVTPFYVPFGSGKNGQLLRQWLFTPREDGKPKLLDICMDSDAVDQVKTNIRKEFLSAQTAVSFIIAFFVYRNDDSDLFVPFELDNWRTGERLTFRKINGNKWLLERGPIGGRDAEKWAKWEREAAGHGQMHNLLTFWFGDNEIGPLDEIAGPSGQKLQQQK